MPGTLTFLILPFLICLSLSIRAMLILSGIYKDPVLRSFETYGEEVLYSPTLHFLLWIILGLIFGMAMLFKSSFLGGFAYLMAILSINAYTRFPIWASRYPRPLLALPRWSAQLHTSTTREERRRIAYLWLRLPRGLRTHYNTNQIAFGNWIDLVLISIV